ncbi:carbohydrate ABC transporter permease [Paenibacillus donghaensis]|uniref:carbohydrate ABC transporter permease n=1 Tax=Paenibacillus donghaensis TaxID=414771 RepID=UPI0018846922|nr:carbohydrate ABC transporter permease [Paenibacillus donghaensis]MBE9914996.1 carbohydrate ABC transporter permease [Paenibacillus donghaensis]
MRKQRSNNFFTVSAPADLLLNVYFVILSLVCVLPVVLILMVSFTSEQSLYNYGYRFFPKDWSLDAYRYLFADFHIVLRAYGVTIFVAVTGSVLAVLTQALYAYPLSRRDFPLRPFFSVIILITMLFSGGLAPFYYIYVKVLNIQDTLLALILPGLTGGFSIFMIRTFFRQTIPFEIIESAKMDGAKEFRIFLRIVLPLSLPVLATMLLFSVIGYWNDFFNCLLFINNEKLYNLQFMMQKALINLQFLQTNFQHLEAQSGKSSFADIPSETIRMAMAVVGMGPIVLTYPFFQKYFVKGLTVGAVKG